MTCTLPQQILLDIVTDVWGDRGLNVLAIGSFPTGTGEEMRRIAYVYQGENVKPLTHGFAVVIDNAAKYVPSSYSPLEAKDGNAIGLVADLYLPQDINASVLKKTLETLESYGVEPPLAVEWMNDATNQLLRTIKNHEDVASVRDGIRQRGTYDGDEKIARLRLDVTLKIRTSMF
jgi:hypothetical protein